MSGRFPDDVIEAAQAAHAKYFPKGPYASVTLAQWAVESAYGRDMPKGSNNPFGIKAVMGQPYVESVTREVTHGESEQITQRFAKYPNIAAAFEAHAKLLATSPIYVEAQRADTVDDYVRAMAKHYATAPNYAEIVLNVIKSFNLTLYDSLPDIAPLAAVAEPGPTGDKPMQKPSVSDFLQFLQDLPFASIGGVIAAGGGNIPLDVTTAETIAAAAVKDFFHTGDTNATPNTSAAVANAVNNPSGAIGG